MPGAHEHDHPSREGPRIVVGYDGSPPARRALEQAAVDAGSLGHVFVVTAHPHAPAALGRPYAQRHEDRDEGPARALIAALEQGEVSALLRTRWEGEIIDGPPPEAIVHVAEARNADRIYLGTRGLGRARSVLGSVAQGTLRLADRPVLVFPERAVEREAARPHVPA